MKLTAVVGISLLGSLAALGLYGEPQPATAQHPEAAEILSVALDYGEGWYEGDAERMKRALHPELAKRMVNTDPRSGRSRLSQQSAMTLMDNTGAGGGKNSGVADQPSEATILDVYENAAIVKISGPQWVDYLQMAKWNSRWVIVNVLWELHPQESAADAR